jgi:hypothetical protein
MPTRYDERNMQLAPTPAWDIVTLPQGVSTFTAKAEDVVVIRASGQTSLDARWDPAVRRILGTERYVAEVVGAGQPSPVLQQARARSAAAPDADDRPPGFLGANCNRSNGYGASGAPFFPRRGG